MIEKKRSEEKLGMKVTDNMDGEERANDKLNSMMSKRNFSKRIYT
mgnify:CR=1 FL=1